MDAYLLDIRGFDLRPQEARKSIPKRNLEESRWQTKIKIQTVISSIKRSIANYKDDYTFHFVQLFPRTDRSLARSFLSRREIQSSWILRFGNYARRQENGSTALYKLTINMSLQRNVPDEAT